VKIMNLLSTKNFSFNNYSSGDDYEI
jgi:hypothetical protein